MTALTLDPTDDDLRAVAGRSHPHPSRQVEAKLDEARRRLFQAGVEAERARAAAEATEEWGIRERSGRVIVGVTAETARNAVASQFGIDVGFALVRRTPAGPWEVQS